MMRRGMSFLQTLALTVAVSAIVTFVVVTSLGGFDRDERSDSIESPPAAGLQERETVGLSDVVIQTVISGDGIVVEEDGAFFIEAPISPSDQAYKLINEPFAIRALIDGGPAGFDCQWAGLTDGDQGLRMRCEIPADVLVVSGLQGTMVVQMIEPTTVQGLPASAVIGRNQVGQVVVKTDSGTEIRTIEIGEADDMSVEVVGGLESGEHVYLYPIESDFREAGGQ